MRPSPRPANLALAVAVVAALVGGAAYGMRLIAQSPAHLVSSCAGTNFTIASPGRRAVSPQAFRASGGKLIPQATRQAARLPDPGYWIVPAGADIVNTCQGVEVTQVEVGTNQRQHTQLFAISVTSFSVSTQPVGVGYLSLTELPGCRARPATSPIRAADHRSIAQFSHPPASLSRSITVTLTPCDGPKHIRGVRLPPKSPISFHILSTVAYRGRQGTVSVSTIRASPLAMRRGLGMGRLVGALQDGSKIWNLRCSGGCPTNNLRWLKKGLIISVSSDLSLRQLENLAGNVVVRK